MAQALVNYLVTQGKSCDVYYFDDIRELSFPCIVKKISFWSSIDFRQYDIVHAHLFRPDLYCALHKRAIKRSKARLITTVHTAIYDDLQYTYGKLISRLIIPLWKLAWRQFDLAVLLTKAAKNYYGSTRFKQVAVINNGRDLPGSFHSIPVADIEMIDRFKKSNLLIGTVCSIDKRKGLEQVLELLAVDSKFAFLIVGDGEEAAKLKQIAQDRNVQDRFKVLGYRSEGFRYHSLFDIFIMPSRSEGLALALLEAIASRIPVVCSAIPEILSVFSESELSYFKLDSVDSLKKACHEAVEKTNKIERAYRVYEKNYMENVMGLNYLKLYCSINSVSGSVISNNL